MTNYTPLTREQKLLAEIVVQLGNVVEAIHSASSGPDTDALNAKITQLRTQLNSLAAERAQLTAALATSNNTIAELTAQLNEHSPGDLTPDSLTEVMTHLGINYDPNNDDPTGNTGSGTGNSSY